MLRNITFFLLVMPVLLYAQFPDPLQLETFNNSLGHVIAHDSLSSSPSSLAMADINGDGLADLLLGFPFWGLQNREEAGKLYVMYGSSALADTFDLSKLDGTHGFVIEGDEAGGNLGREVSAAGDINGDGVEDFLVGAPGLSSQQGACYVLFGEKDRDPDAKVDLTGLDGSNGFVIEGMEPGEELGSNLSPAGDVNGDGFSDLLLGVPKARGTGEPWAGKAFVILGTSTGYGGKLELANLDASQGFVMTGTSFHGFLGDGLAGLYDFNGDGVDDFAVSAWGEDPGGVINSGATYVIFGRASGFGAQLKLADLDGSDGFVIQGINQQDGAGWALGKAGDLNGDGLDDLALTSLGHDGPGGIDIGQVHVVYGKKSGGSPRFRLDSLNGFNGFSLPGAEAGDRAGWTLAALGDVNGDCLDDLLIGAPSADRQGLVSTGELYLLFGNRSRNISSIELGQINELNGFTVLENRDRSFAGSVACGGNDVNGDGRPDIAFASQGNSYLLLGQQSMYFPPEADFSLGPNPNRGLFSMYLKEGSLAEQFSFQLFDLSGRKIKLPNPKSGADCLHFDLQYLTPGIYYLEVRRAGLTTTLRLVIW